MKFTEQEKRLATREGLVRHIDCRQERYYPIVFYKGKRLLGPIYHDLEEAKQFADFVTRKMKLDRDLNDPCRQRYYRHIEVAGKKWIKKIEEKHG